jgi:hypothetical protein
VWLPAVNLVGRRAGVGRQERDQRRLHVELLGGDLQQRGANAGAQLDLAGEDGHLAVGCDLDPRVEQRIRLQTAGQRLRGFGDVNGRAFVGDHELRRRTRGRRERKRDEQRAGDDEMPAAFVDVVVGIHHSALLIVTGAEAGSGAGSPATERTAARMRMRAAAAQIRLHVRAQILLRRFRIALEQRLRAHDHAGDAVAALRGLVLDERALQRPGMLGGAEAFDRAHVARTDRGDRHQAREGRLAVDDDGAGAALAEPAAELRAVQVQVVAQRVQQRRGWIDVERVPHAVDGEGDHRAVSSFLSLAAIASAPVHAGRSVYAARTYAARSAICASSYWSTNDGM